MPASSYQQHPLSGAPHRVSRAPAESSAWGDTRLGLWFECIASGGGVRHAPASILLNLSCQPVLPSRDVDRCILRHYRLPYSECTGTASLFCVATRILSIVSEGQGRRSAHRLRLVAVHRHIVPHHRPPSSAPAQRCIYMRRSLCTATFIIRIVSGGRAKGRGIGADHEACVGT